MREAWLHEFGHHLSTVCLVPFACKRFHHVEFQTFTLTLKLLRHFLYLTWMFLSIKKFNNSSRPFCRDPPLAYNVFIFQKYAAQSVSFRNLLSCSKGVDVMNVR